MSETEFTVSDYYLDADRIEPTNDGLHFDNDEGRFTIDSLHLQYLSVFVDGEELEFDKMTTLRDEDGNKYGRVNTIVYRNFPDDPHFTVELYTEDSWHERLDELIPRIRGGTLTLE